MRAARLIRLGLRRPLLFGQLAIVLMAPPMVLLGWTPAVLPLATAFFVSGLAVAVFSVAWETALQEHIPGRLLSRVAAYDSLGSFVGIPLGTIAFGLLASHHDPGRVAVLGGIAYAAIAMLALLSPEVRRLRHGG